MKRFSILTLYLMVTLILSACGTEATPTASPVDLQGTIAAAAFTVIAETQAAIPTATPPPPTATVTDTPVPTNTFLPFSYEYSSDSRTISNYGKSFNISETGMCFYTQAPLQEGLNLRVHSEHIWDSPRTGIVKWCNRKYLNFYQVGVSFQGKLFNMILLTLVIASKPFYPYTAEENYKHL